MNRSGDLLEVPSQDGRLLWLGVSTEWQFAEDGARYELPILMWAVGHRENDELVLDGAEPFVSVHRAAELAPDQLGSILAAGDVVVGRVKEDLEVWGFWSKHPYRAELRRFAGELSRLRKALEGSDVELQGKAAKLAVR